MLGLAPGGGVRVVVALPGRPAPERLRCALTGEGVEERMLEAEPTHGSFAVFRFDFEDLPDGASCRYAIETADGTALDLEGLDPEALRFTVRSPSPDEAFVVVSCHRPDARQAYPDAGPHETWRRIGERFDADGELGFILMVGDQVYNDPIVPEALDAVRRGDEAAARELIIGRYLGAWSDPVVRAVLARIPSACMWDDHDILDGWGGRPEQFVGESAQVKPAWAAYFELAREAFEALQASRNPNGPLPGAGAVQTTRIDRGSTRILMLDLRSEKNVRSPPGRTLLSERHERAVHEAIVSTEAERLILVTPVVGVRTQPGDDERLGVWAERFFRLNRWTERHPILAWGAAALWGLSALAWLAAPAFVPLGPLVAPWAAAGVFGLIVGLGGGAALAVSRVPHLPHLTDDLTDGLTAPPNRTTFVALLRTLFRWQRESGRRAALVCGDVHLFGLAEILERGPDGLDTLPQVVSSPVTNAPMPTAAAALTTTTAEVELEAETEGLGRLWARNVFWISRRGFTVVRPSGLDRSGNPFIELWIEDHEEPIALGASHLGKAPGSLRRGST